MQPRDGCLEGEPAAAARRERGVVQPGSRQVRIPEAAVHLLQGECDTVGVHPGRPACQSEPDHRPEPAHLGVVGEEGDQGVGDRESLGAEVRERIRWFQAGAVGDGEHPGHAVEHHREPTTALGGVGNPELATGLGQRPLGPGEPRGRRGVGDPQVQSGLRDRQPADDAQRQHHLGAGGELVVAGDEEQCHAVVEPLGQTRVGVGVHGVGRLLRGEPRRQPVEGPATPVIVDPGTLGHAHAPRREVVDRRARVGDGARHRLGGVLLGVVQAA